MKCPVDRPDKRGLLDRDTGIHRWLTQVSLDPPCPDDLKTKPQLVRSSLKTPKAAAVAGIVFSLLLIWILWLLRLAPPTGSMELAAWLRQSSRKVTLALNLVPFAGIAFMWFLGVLRDRLGALEDKFFATVFLGSGLMFLGMMFVAASAGGGLVRAYADA